jgi:hypothetical protein
MRRIVAAIVILALIWAVPPVRGRLSAAAVPVLEKLGPVGAVVIEPARRMAAKSKVMGILRVIASDYNEGRPLPEDANFHGWLRQRLPDETGLDPWGNAYWLSRTRGTLTVGSDGPDRRRGTGDDVKHTIPY